MATASAAFMVAAIVDPSLILQSWRWPALLATLGLGWIGFQISRWWLVWLRLKPARIKQTKDRTPADHALSRRGFLELFVYLLVSLAGLTAYAFTVANTPFDGSIAGLGSPAPSKVDYVLVFLVYFSASFAPLTLAFTLQARVEAKAFGVKMLRDDVVTPQTLAVMLTVAGLVSIFAWAAGTGVISSSGDVGVTIALIVVVVFLAAIYSPQISRHLNVKAERVDAGKGRIAYQSVASLDGPAAFISHLDSLLVKVVAPLSGATLQGWLPHVTLIAVMGLLSSLGYILASPFGLLPISVAGTIAFALGRRWSWVEEDRDTASRLRTTQSKDIHVGFDNDLRDEALMGYAWFFVLVPLALYQIQAWAHPFSPIAAAATGNTFWDCLRFFGSEVAKAVPFVDVWETYNGPIDEPFNAPDLAAKHLVVGARILVNLVLVSALFQALGIWQRSRAQNRLYDAGQIDYFDPFTEAEFFDRGILSSGTGPGKPKRSFEDRVRAHIKQRSALKYSPPPYNEDRLAELIDSDVADIRDGARWMIEEFGVLAGSAQKQLHQLGSRWRKLGVRSGRIQDRPSAERLAGEKQQFERILLDLRGARTALNDDDVEALVLLLADVSKHHDFDFARTLAFEILGSQVGRAAPIALAVHLLDDDYFAENAAWRDRCRAFTGQLQPPLSLFLGRAEARTRVYNALRGIGKCDTADREARALALELLEWMGSELGGDRARPCQQLAKGYAEEVRKSLD